MWGRSRFAMLAALVLGAGSAALGFTQPAPIVTVNAPAKRKKGLFTGRAMPTMYLAGSCPRKDRMNTAAQHKRASKKARNVARHRRHA